MNLTEHAEMEIGYLHLEDKAKEEYLKKFMHEFMEAFGEQGHSGGSAPFAIRAFKDHTKDKIFVDKPLEEIMTPPEHKEGYDFAYMMNNDVYELVKKYHELVNTEEFIVQDIDEGWLKDILYKLMEWKPVTPLQGTPDEWNDPYEWDEKKRYQNKRFSSIFAEDNKGTNAFNVRGKVFEQNGVTFTSTDSKTPVTFPYTVTDSEYVKLEDYVKVPDAVSYYVRYEKLEGDEKPFVKEYTLGYIKSSLDKGVSNSKFYKADYCIMRRDISSKDKDAAKEYYVEETFEDVPIYRVRMEARLRNMLKKMRDQDVRVDGVFMNRECTKPAVLN